MERAKETRKGNHGRQGGDWDWDLAADMPHRKIFLFGSRIIGADKSPEFETAVRIRNDPDGSGTLGILYAHLELLTDGGWCEIHKEPFSRSSEKSVDLAHDRLKDYAEYTFAGRQAD